MFKRPITIRGVRLFPQEMACGTTRYWTRGQKTFLDRPRYAAHRNSRGGYTVTAYAPGADPSGCAGFLAGGDSLTDVVRKLQQRELLSPQEWPYNAGGAS